MSAIVSPIFITSFCWYSNFVIVPVTNDGTSESTLSVATSKSTSSSSIVSPTFLNHLIMAASVILSPSFGILNLYSDIDNCLSYFLFFISLNVL